MGNDTKKDATAPPRKGTNKSSAKKAPAVVEEHQLGEGISYTAFSPDRTFVAFSWAGLSTRVYRTAADMAPHAELPAHDDANATAVALHPSGAQLALASESTLWIKDAKGKTVATIAHEGGAGTPRALTFDASGKQLWLSMEHAANPDGRGGLVSRVFLLDAKSLATLATGHVVGGLADQHHRIFPHPSGGCLFAVSCGQDGSWLHALTRTKTKLEAKQIGGGEGALIDAAGFSADGALFAVGQYDQIGAVPWPAGGKGKRTRLDSGESIIGWIDTFENHVLTPVLIEGDEAALILRVHDLPTLSPVTRFELARGKKPYMRAAYVGAVPGARALTLAGDRALVWRLD